MVNNLVSICYTQMDIILATGGTGGHIFPAITLARALKIQGYNSTLLLIKKQIKILTWKVIPCRYVSQAATNLSFSFF